MELKIKGSGSTWGFVESYAFSYSGASRTVRFLAAFDTETMNLVSPHTYFGAEFQPLKSDDVDKYCRSKKPLHSLLVGKVIPVSVRVSLRAGEVTVTARPLKGSISVPVTSVLLGSPSEKVRDAIQDQLAAFIRAGNLDRTTYYKERVSWARTRAN